MLIDVILGKLLLMIEKSTKYLGAVIYGWYAYTVTVYNPWAKDDREGGDGYIEMSIKDFRKAFKSITTINP